MKLKSVSYTHLDVYKRQSIGVFNTHSKICDGRMEAFIYHLAMMDAPKSLLEEVDNAITAEEGLNICIEAGYGQVVKAMEKGAESRVRRLSLIHI